jgi:hypothetical protein
MKDPEAAKLVAGYATSTLSEAEEKRLMRAAAEDQELFDALADEHDLRDVLDDYQLRRRVLRGIAEANPHGNFLARFLALRPMRYALAGALAMAAFVAVALRFQTRQETPSANYPVALTAGIGTIRMEDVQTSRRSASDAAGDPLSALPPQQAIGASFGLNKTGGQPVYRPGEAMRIGFEVKTPANVVVMETRPDGSTVQLFPNRYISSPSVRAGQQILIPPAGQGDMETDGPLGTRRLRMIAAPSNVDLLGMDLTRMGALAGKVTVIEQGYTVSGGR